MPKQRKMEVIMKKSDFILIGLVLVIVFIAIFSSKGTVAEEEIEYPSNPIDAFKCGRKIKKKKCEIGGTVDMDKCGAKMKKKKCEDGGTVNIDKCGAKIKKKKC